MAVRGNAAKKQKQAHYVDADDKFFAEELVKDLSDDGDGVW